MKLSKLLKSLPDKNFKYRVFGNLDSEVTGLADNTKNIKKGFIFFAIKGIHIDSHALIKESIDFGANVIVCEVLPQRYNLMEAVFIKVDSSRKALALFASAWYGNPSRKLKIIGVTGTKGKTTTTEIIYHILKTSGLNVGVISTLNAKIGNFVYDTGLHVTNPEVLDLHKLLKKMVKSKCEYAVLEVTSHGIDQERVGGIAYEMGVLTNISPEHLDYHKNFENYRNTKFQLFLRSKVSILNRDDDSFNYLKILLNRKSKIVTYGFEKKSDYFGLYKDTKNRAIYVKTKKKETSVYTGLMGKYNAYNTLAAVVVARELNIGWYDINKSLKNFPQVKGRLEEIINSRNFRIYIDFAHTPDSLENVLRLLRGMTKGKLIVVFGCAGERDTQKRKVMGEIASKYANVSIITSEDPRSEDVNRIISEIEEGVKKNSTWMKDKSPDKYLKIDINSNIYFKLPDRGEAIYFAINKIAKGGDIAVICGKGHEKSMCYGNKEFPWSDFDAVNESLRGRIFKIEKA